MLTLKAYAKVNLTLEVLGRRDDGFHDIASIMQTVDLCDTLTFQEADAVELECDREDLRSPGNLVVRAAELLRDVARCRRGARIGLRKEIPVAAGLGGGSSDAAVTLKGLSLLWGLSLSLEDLASLASEIGSDVPFFLYGDTAMAYGRGERVRPLPPADLQWMAVLSPRMDVPQKTRSLYGMLKEAHFTKGALTRKLEARIRGGGDVPPQFLFNAFDAVAFDAFPGLEEYWNTFYSLGAREIHLAGTGPSMFAPVSTREVGTALHLMLRHRYGWDAYLVSARQPQPGDEVWTR